MLIVLYQVQIFMGYLSPTHSDIECSKKTSEFSSAMSSNLGLILSKGQLPGEFLSVSKCYGVSFFYLAFSSCPNPRKFGRFPNSRYGKFDLPDIQSALVGHW